MAPSCTLTGRISTFLASDRTETLPASHLQTPAVKLECRPFASVTLSLKPHKKKGHNFQTCSGHKPAKLIICSGSSHVPYYHLATWRLGTFQLSSPQISHSRLVGQPYSSFHILASRRDNNEVHLSADVFRSERPLSSRSFSLVVGCTERLPERPRLPGRLGGLQGQLSFSGTHSSIQPVRGAVRVSAGDGQGSEKQSADEGNDGEQDDIESEEDEDSFFSGVEEAPKPWSGTYEKAKTLLSSLAKGVSKLETGFNTRQQELGESTQKIEMFLTSDGAEQGNALREAEGNVRKLELQVQALDRERASGELRMAELSSNYEQVYRRLREAEQMATQAQLLQEEVGMQQEEKSIVEQQLLEAKRREDETLERIKAMEEGLAERDSLLQQLQHESALSSSALQQAAKAMVAARDRTLRMEEQLELTGDLVAKERQGNAKARERIIQLNEEIAEAKQVEEEMRTQLEQLAEEVVSKEDLIEKTREESLKSKQMLDLSSRALQEARETIASLEQLVDLGQEKLRQEIEASSEALKSAAQKEHALRQSDFKVRELTAELDALKEEMMNQERAMAAMREDTVRNAKMLMQAAQTRQELEQAQTRIAQLTGQVDTLEEEVRSRDALLSELKSEIDISTEALEVAARYKQELNRTKEREAELEDELEARESLVVELRRELSENMRAQRAEHALLHVEEQVRSLEAERDTLLQGVQTRDEALALMKGELDQSVAMLKAAANNREALKELQCQVEIMKAELQARDERVAAQDRDIAPPPYAPTQNSNSYGNDTWGSEEVDEDNHSFNSAANQSPALSQQRRGGGIWNRGARRGGPARTPR